ncbi:MAG: protein kinase, partial [Thermoanaerobaculia bacterium]|nr:protein kinase [Thermoanaerobaculia bacterium]
MSARSTRPVDRELGEHVALKVLRPESAGRERELQRFRREVQLARKVTHPNVCRLFEFLHDVEAPTARQAPFSLVVMELLEGDTLTQRLDRVGALSPEDTLPIVRQIAAALEAAHRAGIVHRDLKSSNVMLVPTAQGERAVVTGLWSRAFRSTSG